jgi:hypothetical protein
MAAAVGLMAAAAADSTVAREVSRATAGSMVALEVSTATAGSMVGVASTERGAWMERVAWTMAAGSATSMVADSMVVRGWTGAPGSMAVPESTAPPGSMAPAASPAMQT